MELRPYTVFISHASEDLALATWVAGLLDEDLVQYFLDHRHLAAGDDFRETIRSRMQLSNEFLWLLTPDAMRSPWLAVELGMALAFKVRIVPMLHRISVEQFNAYARWQGLVTNLTMASIERFDAYRKELMDRVLLYNDDSSLRADSVLAPRSQVSEVEIARAVVALRQARRRNA